MITCADLMNRFNDVLKTDPGKLPYANPTEDEKSYGGWVTNFKIHLKGNNNCVSLNLSSKDNENKEANLFLLFVLAVAWSRPGQWENAAFFVAYLRLVKEIITMDDVRIWIDEINGEKSETLATKYTKGMQTQLILGSDDKHNNAGGTRRAVSIRHDTINSIRILYSNWGSIINSLNMSESSGNYNIFIDCIRNIGGLGPTKKGKKTSMSMKILLILRELRIQNGYNNIPGELCCVPDARVILAAKFGISDIKLNSNGNINLQIKNSKTIYEKFGDWYDIPLFAFEDLEYKIDRERIDKKNKKWVFRKYKSIDKDFTIPEGIQIIDREAFSDTNITIIKCCDSLEEIREGAFINCTKLEIVHLNHDLQKVHAEAFVNCENLKTIYYDGTEEEFRNIVKNGTFNQNDKMKYEK